MPVVRARMLLSSFGEQNEVLMVDLQQAEIRIRKLFTFKKKTCIYPEDPRTRPSVVKRITTIFMEIFKNMHDDVGLLQSPVSSLCLPLRR